MTRKTGSRSIGVVLGALLLLASGARAHAQDVVTSSVVTFGVVYGASVIVASTSGHVGDKRLYVPLLGPWLDLADRGSCGGLGNPSCDRETGYKILLIGDGIIQAASAIAILTGILRPTRVIASRNTTLTLQLTPVTVAGGNPGLGAFGRF